MFDAILTSTSDLKWQKISSKKLSFPAHLSTHLGLARFCIKLPLKSNQEMKNCGCHCARAIRAHSMRSFVLWRYARDLSRCAWQVRWAAAETSQKNTSWFRCHVFNVFLLRGSCKHALSSLFLFLLVLHVSALLLVQFWAKTINYSCRYSCLCVWRRSSKNCFWALRALAITNDNLNERLFLDLKCFLIWRLL